MTTPAKMLPAAHIRDGKIGILRLLTAVSFSASSAEARRLVEGGAVSLDGSIITDVNAVVSAEGNTVLKVGNLHTTFAKELS